MKNKYVNVLIKLKEEYYEILYSHLLDVNFCGIEERLDEVIISFDENEWTKDIEDKLMQQLEIIDCNSSIQSVESLTERNWNEEWEKHIQPIIVDEKIAITPTWKADEVDSEIKILINPKMSFGTGHHSTTRLCCKLLGKTVKKDSEWADVGTGTGVLAILTIFSGAKSCYAFDNNIWSVENAEENFKLNSVQDKVTLAESDIDSMKLQDYDGIAANLFINLVVRSMDKFYDSLKNRNGDLILSGIMIYDKEEVIALGKKVGFTLIETIIEDEWIAFHFKAGTN